MVFIAVADEAGDAKVEMSSLFPTGYTQTESV